jgi:hypothetical protein
MAALAITDTADGKRILALTGRLDRDAARPVAQGAARRCMKRRRNR